MKTPILLFALLLSCSFFATAQSSSGANIWLGNTYGPTTDWHHPGNWSKGHVPNEMEEVIIPDQSNKGRPCYPVIQYEAAVASLAIHQMARLEIAQEGSLRIANPSTAMDLLIANIDNQGSLLVGEEENPVIAPRWAELQESID